MRSWESLGLKPDDSPSLSMVLLPIFDKKLPGDLKEKWEFELTKCYDDEDDKEINIKKFFQFLEGHKLSKEAGDDTKSSSPEARKRFGREKGSRSPDDEEYTSAQALVGSSDFKKVRCGFCGKNHETIKCPSALNKSPDERWQMLMRRKGAPTCFNCLQPGSISHHSRTCKAPRCPVDKCGRKHYQLLYTPQKSRLKMKETFKSYRAVYVDVRKCAHLRNLKLADTFPRKAAPVDLLVGAEQYYKLVQGKIRGGCPATPIATKSRLGWLLSGPVPGSRTDENTTAMQARSVVIFSSTHKYEVGLPWKRDHPPLVDNYQQSYLRLISIERNLVKHPEKNKMYCEAVNQYINDGHARAIVKEDSKADKIRYLPHHAVFREDRTTTKCRVVFDSSAKTADGVSLNSCLLKGPKQQPDLGHVIIRFRCRRIGLMAVIKRMFLEIKLKQEDQNSHRFSS
ncbi:uncharacterized protein [Montipora foliosa]|uniref:uncharacterized protein n=1 Tax=Montipora foliosa TaxID=591990 RepID=UPI0035F17236